MIRQAIERGREPWRRATNAHDRYSPSPSGVPRTSEHLGGVSARRCDHDPASHRGRHRSQHSYRRYSRSPEVRKAHHPDDRGRLRSRSPPRSAPRDNPDDWRDAARADGVRLSAPDTAPSHPALSIPKAQDMLSQATLDASGSSHPVIHSNIFSDLCFYVAKTADPRAQSESRSPLPRLEAHGAQILGTPGPSNLTHILVAEPPTRMYPSPAIRPPALPGNAQELTVTQLLWYYGTVQLESGQRTGGRDKIIVSTRWAEECMTQGKLLPTEDYAIMGRVALTPALNKASAPSTQGPPPPPGPAVTHPPQQSSNKPRPGAHQRHSQDYEHPSRVGGPRSAGNRGLEAVSSPVSKRLSIDGDLKRIEPAELALSPKCSVPSCHQVIKQSPNEKTRLDKCDSHRVQSATATPNAEGSLPLSDAGRERLVAKPCLSPPNPGRYPKKPNVDSSATKNATSPAVLSQVRPVTGVLDDKIAQEGGHRLKDGKPTLPKLSPAPKAELPAAGAHVDAPTPRPPLHDSEAVHSRKVLEPFEKSSTNVAHGCFQDRFGLPYSFAVLCSDSVHLQTKLEVLITVLGTGELVPIDAATYIVVDQTPGSSSWPSLNEHRGIVLARTRASRAVVSHLWIEDCTSKGRLLDHRPYVVHAAGEQAAKEFKSADSPHDNVSGELHGSSAPLPQTATVALDATGKARPANTAARGGHGAAGTITHAAGVNTIPAKADGSEYEDDPDDNEPDSDSSVSTEYVPAGHHAPTSLLVGKKRGPKQIKTTGTTKRRRTAVEDKDLDDFTFLLQKFEESGFTFRSRLKWLGPLNTTHPRDVKWEWMFKKYRHLYEARIEGLKRYKRKSM